MASTAANRELETLLGKLRRIRERDYKTKADAAEAFGMDPSHYLRLERGEVGVSLFSAERIANKTNNEITALELLRIGALANRTDQPKEAA